jgi:hypothetical protein
VFWRLPGRWCYWSWSWGFVRGVVIQPHQSTATQPRRPRLGTAEVLYCVAFHWWSYSAAQLRGDYFTLGVETSSNKSYRYFTRYVLPLFSTLSPSPPSNWIVFISIAWFLSTIATLLYLTVSLYKKNVFGWFQRHINQGLYWTVTKFARQF